jgi:hypothetical protein
MHMFYILPCALSIVILSVVTVSLMWWGELDMDVRGALGLVIRRRKGSGYYWVTAKKSTSAMRCNTIID